MFNEKNSASWRRLKPLNILTGQTSPVIRRIPLLIRTILIPEWCAWQWWVLAKTLGIKTNISSRLFYFGMVCMAMMGLSKKFRKKKTYISSLKFQNDPSGLQLLSFEKHPQSNRFFFFSISFPAQFGCLAWSSNEQFLLYVAEKKVPKAFSYFERQKPSTGKFNNWSLLLYFMFKAFIKWIIVYDWEVCFIFWKAKTK